MSPSIAAKNTLIRRFSPHFWQILYTAKDKNGPATAIEKVLAPRVVNPPWAKRTAWKIRTMMPSMLTARGPNRMAPSPVPVMWEQLPVTEGIFKEEITKMNAPDIASIVISRRSLLTVFLMEKNPAAKNGRLRTPQAIQNRGGSCLLYTSRCV